MNAKMKTLMMAAAMAAAIAAEAAVSVSNVVCTQQYPWNGKVDIDYEVFADDPAADVWVYATGFDKDANVSMGVRAISGDGANAPVKPGKHRMTWDVTSDYPGFNTTKFTVKMTALTGGAPYMVVDLSGGVDALSYPVSYLSSVPAGGWTDEYKTTKLVLRLIPPGTFMMGSPSDELGRDSNETLHQVTLTKPFYIGVFEITQKQWQLVLGSNPSYWQGDLRPVERVSYTMIRGGINGIAYPVHDQVDANSFIGRLRSKINMLFDLPTEAQWEYACRAGTSSALNNGKNISQTGSCDEADEVAVCRGTVAIVGTKMCNAWGLYDMHGNISEWCRDVYVSSLGASSVVDPVGRMNSTATDRVVKSGCARQHGAYDDYNGHAAGIRSARRMSCGQDSYWFSDWSGYSDGGLRVVCLPAE